MIFLSFEGLASPLYFPLIYDNDNIFWLSIYLEISANLIMLLGLVVYHNCRIALLYRSSVPLFYSLYVIDCEFRSTGASCNCCCLIITGPSR